MANTPKGQAGGLPVRLNPEFCEPETCCYCGTTHSAGIYVRADPDGLLCLGVHAEDATDAED